MQDLILRCSIKCLQCGKLLRQGKTICLFCGARVGGSKADGAINRYSYHEEYSADTGFRKIELSLSDEAVKEAAPLFGQQQLPPMRNSQPVNGSHVPINIPEFVVRTDDPVVSEDGQETLTPPTTSASASTFENASSLADMFEVDNDGYLISRHADYKGKSRKIQQERFTILYTAAYPACREGAPPNLDHIREAARRNGLLDNHYVSYFHVTARQYLTGANGNYTLNPSGKRQLAVILEEIHDKSKEGLAYWNQTAKPSGSHTRTTKEDRDLISQWVAMPSRCNDFDIRQKSKADELAMFALYDITKELRAVEAVKPGVAYEYLIERYKTVSVKQKTFNNTLHDKSNTDKFQKTDAGLFYLTQQAENTVLQWMNVSG